MKHSSLLNYKSNYNRLNEDTRPEDNHIKHFTAVIHEFCNKLECLSLQSLSSLVYWLWLRPEPT
jgi:hypothetical protein